MVISKNLADHLPHRQTQTQLPYVGLPNILCGEFIVPELLQDDATPENLAQALLNTWRDADYRAWLDGKS